MNKAILHKSPPTATPVDLENWERKQRFAMFRNVSNPHFSVTADIDVTRLIEVYKPQGVSVFNAVLYAIMKTVNGIPEFRTRFKGDQIYQYDFSDPSYTIPIQGTAFAFCETPYCENWQEFNAACLETSEQAKQQTHVQENETSDHLTWLTCAPWVHFTALAHASNGPDDCMPRIAWGKFTKRGDRWHMPVNIQAHHSLVDGYHAGLLINKTEERLQKTDFSL